MTIYRLNGGPQSDERSEVMFEGSQTRIKTVHGRRKHGVLQNLGALPLDDNLEGKLDTITSQRRFTLTVTPEPSPRAAAPTHPPVFTADVDRSN